MDSLYVANYDDAITTRINDSTLEFTRNLSEPDYLYIMIDGSKRPRWHTRVWIDPKIKLRELVIDYSKRTSTLKNPNESDMILQTTDSLDKMGRNITSDSLASIFIDQNPASYLSLWFLTHGVARKDRSKKLDLFNKLSPALKIYPLYNQTRADLFDRKYPNTNDPFKEFSLTDINDNIFNSASIKNKWVLLHFWSNGCAPCIKEMDDMVNFYSSIDTSKIAFISIALDDDKVKWKKSKTTNKIKWASVWQPDNFYGDLCLNYNVTAMPFFILFNKEKKIHLITFGANEFELIRSTLRLVN